MTPNHIASAIAFRERRMRHAWLNCLACAMMVSAGVIALVVGWLAVDLVRWLVERLTVS